MSFTDWLDRQVDRRDAIGDLARDRRGDPCWPAGAGYDAYRDHLDFDHDASPAALAALSRAWQAWLDSLDPS